ncbi:MAG: hypothetical protein R3C68_00550 [Myxococcota bacterium]
MPFATFAPAGGVKDGQLYVFGGMQDKTPDEPDNFKKRFEYINHVYRFDGERWQHTGRFLAENKGFSQVVTMPDGSLGILGGHQYGENNSNVPLTSFEVFDVNKAASE